MRDTTMSDDQLKYQTSFCVVAHKGLSKTIHETAFKDLQQITRLSVLVEKGGLPVPGGHGLFKYTSLAGRLAPAKPKLLSVGARPGSRKTAQQIEVPTPNADFNFENGKLILVAKRDIKFGEVITVPMGKVFESTKETNPLAIFKDAKKLKDAALHKATMADAPENIRKLAETEHPRVPPALPPQGSLSVPPRDVSNEVWKEQVLEGKKGAITFIDYLFDGKEAASLAGALCRSGTPTPMPYHIGFETNTRLVAGAPFAAVIKHLFSRATPFLPKTVAGHTLKGVGNQGMLLHLTPGEELLPLTMTTGLQDGTGLPFALMLSNEGGSLALKDSEHTIAFKPGRLVFWSEGTNHKIPVNTKGTMIVLFSYLIYQ
eukprot:TRINITY_DN48324_c0_g1_i1.p1 TRINITY_DN48324_c0_g1~~TRINITY_DN48324_c0_g1_i1.p1  ORF type:complete len:373 (+),score=58.45 TRINITY_DN48324_c0_g1_i1:110-1228(+)